MVYMTRTPQIAYTSRKTFSKFPIFLKMLQTWKLKVWKLKIILRNIFNMKRYVLFCDWYLNAKCSGLKIIFKTFYFQVYKFSGNFFKNVLRLVSAIGGLFMYKRYPISAIQGLRAKYRLAPYISRMNFTTIWGTGLVHRGTVGTGCSRWHISWPRQQRTGVRYGICDSQLRHLVHCERVAGRPPGEPGSLRLLQALGYPLGVTRGIWWLFALGWFTAT